MNLGNSGGNEEFPHVGSVEIGNRNFRWRRARVGDCCNLGDRGRIAVLFRALTGYGHSSPTF